MPLFDRKKMDAGMDGVAALNTIRRIVRQATNEAANWCKFFVLIQLPSEPISNNFVFGSVFGGL